MQRTQSETFWHSCRAAARILSLQPLLVLFGHKQHVVSGVCPSTHTSLLRVLQVTDMPAKLLQRCTASPACQTVLVEEMVALDKQLPEAQADLAARKAQLAAALLQGEQRVLGIASLLADRTTTEVSQWGGVAGGSHCVHDSILPSHSAAGCAMTCPSCCQHR